MGETNEECEERVEERWNTQAHDTWMVWRALTPWANVVWDIIMNGGQTRENVTCEGVLFTPPVSCKQIAISCKRSCYNKFKKCMSSTSFHFTATMRYWKKKKNATFGIDEKGLVQVVSSLLWLLFGSLIGVSSVHFFLICSVRYTSFSYISHTHQRMGNRSGLPVPTFPSSMHFSSVQQVLSCESRYTGSRWKRSWIPSKFFLIHLFRAIAVPSTTRSLHSDDVVRDWESIQSPSVKILAWIRLQPRDVHKCNWLQ